MTNGEDFAVERGRLDGLLGGSRAFVGGAIDSENNLAAVSLSVAMRSLIMSTGSGSTVTVGSNPIGGPPPAIAYGRSRNNGGSGTASIVDELQQSVKQTVTTGAGLSARRPTKRLEKGASPTAWPLP